MSAFNFRQVMARMLGQTFAGARDLYAVCGYEKELNFDLYWNQFRRNGIAKRICCAYPDATWSDRPTIKDENGENKETSQFVASFEEFVKRTKLFSYVNRADMLSQVGQFSILVLGFQDGINMDAPLKMANNPLLYIAAYSQKSVASIEYEKNTASPRFNLPLFYNVSLCSENGTVNKTAKIHYTRIMHFAEHLEDSEIFAAPYLEDIYNWTSDIEKVLGATGECFWLNANKGISWEIDAESEIDQSGIDAAKEQAEEFSHQLRRSMVTKGMKANVLQNNVSDPSATIDNILSLISGSKGIPKRILIGSESGQLASSQDENNWLARVDERKRNYAAPCILVPLIELMIQTGNIEQPKGEWQAEWDLSAGLNETEKSIIAMNKATAVSTYCNTLEPERVMSVDEFRSMIDLDGMVGDPSAITEDDQLDEMDIEVSDQFNKMKAAL